MKVICTIAGTSSYLFALSPCIRRVQSAVFHARKRREIEFIFVGITDKVGEKIMQKVLPKGSAVLVVDMEEGGTRYKQESQLLIANLQQAGFAKAVEMEADLCWSVESDILVPYNALSCMLDMLEFDDGYYDVAFCTYPSQSGGMFLGGHGSPNHPIEEDHIPEERKMEEDLEKRYKESLKALESVKAPNNKEEGEAVEELHKTHRTILDEIKECPPLGNVFELNAKKWRRRGWLDNAYPGIGKGAVLETDWTGMGCNLLSRKALSLASFDGYEGGGTQDLFLNWRRWKPEGLRFCVIPHTVCEHVVSDNKGGRVHCFSHHEPQGEHKGHLRVQHKPFYKFDGKDKFSKENDGIIKPPPAPET